MKNVGFKHKSKNCILGNSKDSEKTLINSLSPNFFYKNKFGGIVYPIQCYLY